MPGMKRKPIEERFAASLVKGSEDTCWGWTGPVTNKGHPTLGRGGKGGTQTSARKLAYRLACGSEPDREVLTTCDTKTCLNPRHLVLAGGGKSMATLQKRFEAKVKKGGPDECWLWTDKPIASGYGKLSTGHGSSPVLAHRLAWQLANGDIPGGLFVKQRCGNRLCCNPAHLYLSLNPIAGPEVSAIAVETWLRSRA
ncbi:MAG: HNH endonuclease [Bryobacteraceae bacterium]|nr:HNH endonuclease [Bryobacteraceae bacterium]